MRRVALLLLAAGAVLAAATTALAATPTLHVTPIGRLPFPERGYVIDLPNAAAVGRDQVTVRENGVTVGDFAFDALSTSGLRYGAILAIDASDSMRGKPEAAALKAARSFVAHRGQTEAVGLVTFNGRVTVVQHPTAQAGQLNDALAHEPALSYGTKIYDGLWRSLDTLHSGKFSTGAIVLLSDGADVGSTTHLQKLVDRAKGEHVRIFTVGLRSGAFDAGTLKSIADQTGGSYAQATSPAELSKIYQSLSNRLANEYLVQYRSVAAPKHPVDVQIAIDGVGRAGDSYTAPTPSGLAPFHRSFWSSFLLSSLSLLLVALVAGAIVLFLFRALLEASRSKVVERMMAFTGAEDVERVDRSAEWKRRTRRSTEQGSVIFGRLRRRIADQLDIGRIDMSPTSVIWLTVGATILIVYVLSLLSGIIAVLGLATPLVSRALIRRKVRKVRDEFAEQLPPNLQVLASALRAGHSFNGAFRSCIDHAHEPSKSELSRAITDEQLGMPMDDAIRRVSVRMASRDLEQVALLAELQRTTGGNAAEILDTVVGTLRERADIRRLVRTLTAQGRMARVVLTALPILTGLGFWAIQPNLFSPFVHAGVGQVLFVIAAIMVGLGSMVIQRIVEIEV